MEASEQMIPDFVFKKLFINFGIKLVGKVLTI